MAHATSTRDAGAGSDAEQATIVDAVVVTYGRADLVRRCLTALTTGENARRLRVTVVDNASPDETADMVRSEFPSVRLVRRDHNDGFAIANNVALRDADLPYVLVVNPDTEVGWPTIAHLVELLERERSIGVCGCRLLLSDGTLDHAAKRFIPTPGDAFKYFLLRILRRPVAGRYVASDIPDDGFGDVDSVNGAFMLIRTTAMREVGLLDERYFMYGEDLDWCVRFRKANWRVVYDGSVSALHIKGGSSNKRRSWRLNYHFHRSMLLFYRAHLAPDAPAALNAAVYAAIVFRCAALQLLNVVHGQRRSGRAASTLSRTTP